MDFLKQDKIGIIISVKVIPNSSFDNVLGYSQEFIKIKITAPANENKANKYLVEFLAKMFNIPKTRVEFISGEKSKIKRLRLIDADFQKVNEKILSYGKISS